MLTGLAMGSSWAGPSLDSVGYTHSGSQPSHIFYPKGRQNMHQVKASKDRSGASDYF